MTRKTIVTAEELRRLGRDWMECHAQFKAIDPDAPERRITGFASTGTVDRMGDIIEPGAFKKGMKRFLKSNPALLMHHGNDLEYGLDVYGTIDQGEVTDKGFTISAVFGHGTDPTDPMERAWNRISQGLLRAFSVGFKIMRREDILDEQGDVTGWRILDLDLYEVSIVSIPANPHTLFDLARAVQNGTDCEVDLYGRGLWGRSPNTTRKQIQPVNAAEWAAVREAYNGLAQRMAVMK